MKTAPQIAADIALHCEHRCRATRVASLSDAVEAGCGTSLLGCLAGC